MMLLIVHPSTQQQIHLLYILYIIPLHAMLLYTLYILCIIVLVCMHVTSSPTSCTSCVFCITAHSMLLLMLHLLLHCIPYILLHTMLLYTLYILCIMVLVCMHASTCWYPVTSCSWIGIPSHPISCCYWWYTPCYSILVHDGDVAYSVYTLGHTAMIYSILQYIAHHVTSCRYCVSVGTSWCASIHHMISCIHPSIYSTS